jgi:hypothetical protein
VYLSKRWPQHPPHHILARSPAAPKPTGRRRAPTPRLAEAYKRRRALEGEPPLPAQILPRRTPRFVSCKRTADHNPPVLSAPSSRVPASLLLCIPSLSSQIKCHTLQSLFACKSLKTNKSDPHKVTHFFKVSVARTIISVFRRSPRNNEQARSLAESGTSDRVFVLVQPPAPYLRPGRFCGASRN